MLQLAYTIHASMYGTVTQKTTDKNITKLLSDSILNHLE